MGHLVLIYLMTIIIIIHETTGWFIIVITERRLVGVILGETVYLITKISIHPIGNHNELTDHEVIIHSFNYSMMMMIIPSNNYIQMVLETTFQINIEYNYHN